MSAHPPSGPVNAMSIDVEDYFQVQAFASTVRRDEWDAFPSRVEANTARLLKMFSDCGTKATFFTLGWVADRFPGIVRDIVAGGHELASHGYGHQRVDGLTPNEFRADVARAKGQLEAIGGAEVKGYRAPTFSIGPRNPWAFDVLAETGHRYSSSVYPIKHDLYGAPGSSRVPYKPGPSGLVELPMTTLDLAGSAVPLSGGGYFRLMPYWLYRTGLRRFHAKENRPSIFYLHPWEIDAEQPRISGVSRASRFRHYVNIPAVPSRLESLLRDFRWNRIETVFAAALGLPEPVAS